MLFENKTKERIKEKFYNKSIFNHSRNNEILNNIYNGVGGTRNKDRNKDINNKKNNISPDENDSSNDNSDDNNDVIDDLYNDGKRDLEDDLNLPVDDEVSKFLPELNALTGYNYRSRDSEYEMKLELLKGYPKERKHIKFVIFTVNTSSVLPFLLFLFYKKENKDTESFIIPELKKDPRNGVNSDKNIAETVISKLFSNITETHKDKQKKKQNPVYRGYKSYLNENYLFFEYIPDGIDSNIDEDSGDDDSEEELNEVSRAERFNRNDKLIWATVSEIVEDKKILNFSIEPESSDFFINNLDVISLYKDGGVLKHETPIIAYYGGYHKTTNYTAVFGVSKRSNYASLGPFYYFASYENAMRYAIFSATNSPVKIDGEFITVDEEGRFDKGGMVRFAVFVGRMKLYDNKGRPDVIHQINIKKEPETSWVEGYNSAFIGLYELTHEGKKIYNQARYVVKQYSQQIPLTYHYVNTDVKIVEGDYSNIFIE